MQRSKIFAIAATALFICTAPMVSTAYAQTGLPEYSGEFVAKTPQGYVPLERKTARKDNQFEITLGYKVTYVVPGSQSSVQLPAGSNMVFYVRARSQHDDPQSLITIYKMKVEKNLRRVIAGSQEAGFTSTRSATPTVPYTATRKGSDFFEIRPESSLLPGEYGLSFNDTNEIYLFGVVQ